LRLCKVLQELATKVQGEKLALEDLKATLVLLASKVLKEMQDLSVTQEQ
jgi:hypothetical protein